MSRVTLGAVPHGRRKFTDEQLSELLDSGVSRIEAAERLGVHPQTIYKWCQLMQRRAKTSDVSERGQIAAPDTLRRELVVAGVVIQAIEPLTPEQRRRVLAYACQWSADPANNPEEHATDGTGTDAVR